VTAVEIRGVTQTFGDVRAVDNVSFTLPSDGIYGPLGRNGSGKSTLLSIAAAFRRPTGGSVLIDGKPVWENAELTREVCLIREGGDVADSDASVEGCLEFTRMARPHWDQDYALSLLNRFQVPLKKKLGTLSRGQRAAFACTLGLASRAPVTLFDETYLGLDAPSRYAFYDELLKEYMDTPRLVVISTHLISELESLLSEVVILDRGRVLVQDQVERLQARGLELSGPAEAVDDFVRGRAVLSERQLGRTKAAVIYGELGPDDRAQAAQLGLDLGPLPLQDLFVHLTAPERSAA
jgi:ABC-2 type transport system ATP-binding protein